VSETQAPPAWQRPPFAAGNDAAATHGAWSPRLYEPIGEELYREYVAGHPQLEDYAEALAALCRIEARVLLLDKHLAESGLVDKRGKFRDRPLALYRSLEGQAMALRGRLGLDPMSQAKLAVDRAQAAATASALPSVRDAGRAALAARGLAALPVPPSGDAA